MGITALLMLKQFTEVDQFEYYGPNSEQQDSFEISTLITSGFPCSTDHIQAVMNDENSELYGQFRGGFEQIANRRWKDNGNDDITLSIIKLWISFVLRKSFNASVRRKNKPSIEENDLASRMTKPNDSSISDLEACLEWFDNKLLANIANSDCCLLIAHAIELITDALSLPALFLNSNTIVLNTLDVAVRKWCSIISKVDNVLANKELLVVATNRLFVTGMQLKSKAQIISSSLLLSSLISHDYQSIGKILLNVSVFSKIENDDQVFNCLMNTLCEHLSQASNQVLCSIESITSSLNASKGNSASMLKDSLIAWLSNSASNISSGDKVSIQSMCNEL